MRNLIFGSPRATNSMLTLGLIDGVWLFLNPILIGEGIPLFNNIIETIKLQLIETKTFSSGVIALHYEIKREA